MHPLKSLLATTIVALGTLAGAAAPAYRTDTNPGLLYWQAFQFLPTLAAEDKTVFDGFHDEDVDDVYLRVAANYNTALTLVRRAASLKTPCDWGIDLADGADTLLPHLAKVKAVALAARFRAKAFLHQGKENEAVEDLVAAFVLARRAPLDGTLIGVLVQIASENILISTVAENFHAFSPPALQRIQAGIDACPPRTTVASSIGSGERCFVPWVIDQIESVWAQSPGDHAKAYAAFRVGMVSKLGNEGDLSIKQHSGIWDSLWQAAGGTKEGLIAQMRLLDALYLQLKTVNELPYVEYASANQKFYAEVGRSTNAFVQMFFPALEKARSKEFFAQANLEMLRAAIQYRLGGMDAFRLVNDPFGQGPFGFQRFKYDEADRGFEVRSALQIDRPVRIIFVEKPGVWFEVMGLSAGKKTQGK